MICSTIIPQTSNSSSSTFRWARTKRKTILDCDGQNLFRTVEKILAIFSVLGKLTHIWGVQKFCYYVTPEGMAYYLSVVGNWDAHIRNCEGLWSDAMHTRCFEVVFPCRSRNPPPSQLILVEGTPLQSLLRRLSARSSTLKVFLTRWIRTVSQNQLGTMERVPTMVPFLLLVLMPTSNAFHLPGQRNHGERSDSQFCMTENNVSLCV